MSHMLVILLTKECGDTGVTYKWSVWHFIERDHLRSSLLPKGCSRRDMGIYVPQTWDHQGSLQATHCTLIPDYLDFSSSDGRLLGVVKYLWSDGGSRWNWPLQIVWSEWLTMSQFSKTLARVVPVRSHRICEIETRPGWTRLGLAVKP